jgi:RimJ/RimL family protein N-acetyltransferase
LSLSAVEIHVNARNVASQKVALNAGFVFTGEVSGRPESDGRPSRMLVYVLEALSGR